ncbi:MAG: ABC transporter substrate-binding protein [Rickettsiales bacterium]|nr:ABC transporter substrate-binding protein [Rickettsiales bacterium]
MSKVVSLLITLIVVVLIVIGVLTFGGGKTSDVSAFNKDKVYKIGVDPTSVPDNFYDANGKIVGFDPDLMEAMAEVIGIKYEHVSMEFDGIIPALQNGNIDLSLTGMFITPERQKKIDFGDSYFESGIQIVVKSENDTIKDFDDLKGKKVGCAIGSAQSIYLRENGLSDEVIELTTESMFQSLKTGHIDAMVISEDMIFDYNKKNNDLKPVGPVVARRGVSYGVAKGKNGELLKELNRALSELKKNGVYDKIYEKWYEGRPRD